MNTLSRVTIALSLALLAAGPLMAQTGHDLFQQALVKERADGDLRGAITIYERIVREFTADRTLAAKALVQLGQCYETLGSTEAERAYRRVVREFADQNDLVVRAQARLAVLQRTARESANLDGRPTFTKIEIASRPQNGVLSPDGRRLAFVSDGGVWVVPLHGNVDPNVAGEPVRIADVGHVWDNASQLAWSGDGRWIAVNGTVDTADAVYVVPVAGGDPRVIRMPTRGSHAYSYRLGLAPDGGTLAFSALEPNQMEGPNETQNRFIYSVSVSGEEPRQLTRMTGRLPAFSPDGRTIAYVSHRQRQEGNWESDLWLVPVSGGQPVKVISSNSGRIRGPVWSPDGAFIAAHHEPGLNNYSAQLWIIEVASASSGPPPTTIELPTASWNMLAGWTPDDRLGVFMTTPEDAGVAFTVPASGGRAVQVTPEHGRPSQLVWSPDGSRIYLKWEPDKGDSIPSGTSLPPGDIGSIPAGGGRVSALLAGRRDLAVGFGLDVSPDGKRIAFMGIEGIDSTIGRRPQADQIGIWTVAVGGGEPERLTSGPTPDVFPRWSPDGRWIAFQRMAENSHWNVYVVPATGGEARRVTSDADSVQMGWVAFSPDGRRIAFFSRSRGAVRVIPVQGGEAETLVTLGRLDELAWSPDGTQLAYTVDGNIWVVQLHGGTRRELATGLSRGARYSSLAWSPDGERIAFVVSRPKETEFWLISDFLPEKR